MWEPKDFFLIAALGCISVQFWFTHRPKKTFEITLKDKSPVRLTKLVKAAGCAAKLSPVVLRSATENLIGVAGDPRLLVGFEWADDAGVIAFDSERALVVTVDFFTPIVDDPYTFGAISAANALSDVYAMGGEPICGVNIVGFPDSDLDPSVLHSILQGGLDKLREAGAVLAGGHSVRDPEIKFGVAVTGEVHPLRIWRNGGALPNDQIVLTKPIGTGVLTTARKRDNIDESVLQPAIYSMQRLNQRAKRAAEQFNIHACTDITGNGLVGHLWEMARASSCDLVIRGPDVPIFPRVRELAALGNSPGGCRNNAAYVGSDFILQGGDETTRAIALDPQTSGGLAFAIAKDDLSAFLQALRSKEVTAWVIGSFEAGSGKVSILGDIGENIV